jgi:ABC-type lipoprotein release transport system permease subunit
METIKQNLLQLPSVKSVSLTFELPERVPGGRIVLYPDKNTGTEGGLNLPLIVADEDYAKTLGIQLKAGSFFNESQFGIVLNETAVKQLGFEPDNIVGRKILTPVGTDGLKVAGVVKDYNASSMQEKIGPVGFIHVKNRNLYRFLAVKLNTDNMLHAMETIRDKWKSLVPDAPFDYSFMDEKFASLYQSELQLKKASGIATVLNLIIVLLGIVGVVTFMLQKRMKEMAVRKVLGANALDIIFIFLKEYALLILIANIIAWPAAYLITEKLLDNFAYRVGQNAGTYLLALVIVAFISFALVGMQCFRTAVANPVKSLKSD